MKSLSDILTREKKAVEEIYALDQRANKVQHRLDEIKEIKIECQSKELGIAENEAELRELGIRVLAATDILENIRAELREYIRELLFGQNEPPNDIGITLL